MACCLNTLTACIIILVVLAALGYLFFRWAFTKKGSTRVIRGPFGFRVEVDEDLYKPKITQRAFTKSWTCTCGETVKAGMSSCPACGKSREKATVDAEYEDQPDDDSDYEDPLGGNMIDLSDD